MTRHKGKAEVAVAVEEDGRRQILAVELANRESRSSWRDFLSGLKARGLATGQARGLKAHGVEFVVSDNHEGLKAAIREVLPEAAWQRCYVHFLRNALGYVPRKVDDDRLQELRWFGACPRAGRRPDPGDRRDIAEVRRDIAQWLATRTVEPGAETPHSPRAHLPQRRELPAPGTGAGGRDARELAGSDALPQGPSDKKETLRALAAGRRPGVGNAALHGGAAPPTPNITTPSPLQNLTHTTPRGICSCI
jgi:hypothetical protein